jgi:hypothetical protein
MLTEGTMNRAVPRKVSLEEAAREALDALVDIRENGYREDPPSGIYAEALLRIALSQNENRRLKWGSFYGGF